MPSLRDVVGLLNWEHWEGWSCVGAGRAWGWAGCSVDVTGARSAFGGGLRAFLPYTSLLLGQEGPASGTPPLFDHHLPILARTFPPKCQFWGAKGRHMWVSPLLSSHPPPKLLAWEQRKS